MQVVLVVISYPSQSETFIRNKFVALLKEGIDVAVVCQRRGSLCGEESSGSHSEAVANARVFVGWPTDPWWKVVLLWPVAFLCALWRQPVATVRYLRRAVVMFGWKFLKQFYLDARLISLNPDIVHFEFGTLATKRMYLRELLGSRVVVSFRGFDIKLSGLKDEEYFTEVWRKADHLHFLGDALRERAVKRGYRPGNGPGYSLIAPAIDVDRFRGATRPVSGCGRGKVRILSIGRLDWVKGYEYGLQAIRRVKDAGVELEYWVVGEGPYRDAIEYAVHQLGLSAEVRLLGAKTQSEITEHLNGADIFLHSAVSEGFCNAVLEAQASGLPVVCSDADGLVENVVSGVTGFVVKRRCPEAMAEVLLRLCENMELRRRMGEAGTARVRAHFRTDQQVVGFVELYRSLMVNEIKYVAGNRKG